MKDPLFPTMGCGGEMIWFGCGILVVAHANSRQVDIRTNTDKTIFFLEIMIRFLSESCNLAENRFLQNNTWNR
jgi:hypothetical protein